MPFAGVWKVADGERPLPTQRDRAQMVTGGVPAMLAVLTEAGISPEENRAALAGNNPHR